MFRDIFRWDISAVPLSCATERPLRATRELVWGGVATLKCGLRLPPFPCPAGEELRVLGDGDSNFLLLGPSVCNPLL